MKWLYGFLCLIFLILFHEFGHFLAAKLCGVKVESFSLGFGPVLLHKKIGYTDYRISLLPLGGYCGMKGEDAFSKAIEAGLSEIPGEPDSLYGTHPLKRALIGFAGPFNNFLLAVIFLSLFSGIGYEYSTLSNKIILANDLYENSCMVAQNAGLLTGDKIIQVENHKTTDFSEIAAAIETRAEKKTKITVDRNGEILEFILIPEFNKERGTGIIGIAGDNSEIIRKHTPHYNFFQAIGKGISDSFNFIGVTFSSLKFLFRGMEFTDAVQGPVRVTEMIGSTVQESFSVNAKIGFIVFLQLMSYISLSLCIMNLLPIPVLDGGIILFAFIQTITRKQIKPKVQYYIQMAGLGIIVLIFIIAASADITYFIGKGIKK